MDQGAEALRVGKCHNPTIACRGEAFGKILEVGDWVDDFSGVGLEVGAFRCWVTSGDYIC